VKELNFTERELKKKCQRKLLFGFTNPDFCLTFFLSENPGNSGKSTKLRGNQPKTRKKSTKLGKMAHPWFTN